jgi:hypothetical protein
MFKTQVIKLKQKLMIKNNIKCFALFFFCAGILLVACRKGDVITSPEQRSHFAMISSGNYFINTPGEIYKIPLGITTVSSIDRTINISVTSPTGAVQGTHYTLNKTSFIIPAGKAVDSIVVAGNYTQYTAGRKDSLIFKIEPTDKGGIAPIETNQTFTLLMRGPCFEGEINSSLQDLLGDYTRTRDTLAGVFDDLYSTTVKSATLTSPTTANIVIANIFNDGWNDLTFKLDWTDLNDRKVTQATQNAGGNAGVLFTGAAGQPFGLASAAGGVTGTFSFCNQTIIIKGRLGIFGVGYAPNLYTVKLAR